MADCKPVTLRAAAVEATRVRWDADQLPQLIDGDQVNCLKSIPIRGSMI